MITLKELLRRASKLAPYTHPKLEAIEVKSEVEHRFVIRAPNQIASVDEWVKQTGAQRLKIEQHVNDQDVKPQEEEMQQDDIAEDEKLTLDPDTNNPDADPTYSRRAPNIKLTRNKLIN